MKKLLMIAALSLSANCFAGQLTDYTQIKDAIVNGDNLRIATDYTKCKGEDSTKDFPRFSLAVFSPDAIVVYPDGSIKTALKHFTLNEPHAPGKPVYQFVVYTIRPNASVRIATYVLDAVNYSMVAPEAVYNCSVADGTKFYTK